MVAVLLACLMSAPADCREHEIPLLESMPVMQWQEAQLKAASWLEKHPGVYMASLKVLRGRGA